MQLTNSAILHYTVTVAREVAKRNFKRIGLLRHS